MFHDLHKFEDAVFFDETQYLYIYTPERKDKLDVELSYTNPYITDAWAYPGVVEFLLIEK